MKVAGNVCHFWCVHCVICRHCRKTAVHQKCILSIPRAFSYRAESEGFFVCRCWMGLGFYRYLSLLSSPLRQGRGSWATQHTVAMVSSTALPLVSLTDTLLQLFYLQHRTVNHLSLKNIYTTSGRENSWVKGGYQTVRCLNPRWCLVNL